MADILDRIAAGPTPVQPVNVLGNAAQVASIQQQRAQTANTQAQLPLIAAQTQGAQEQAHGITLDNVLKQRNVNAQQALVGLLQKHTQKLPDGSTATDMGSVLGEYRSMYPDKALELEGQAIDIQNRRTLAAKNDYELKAAQQGHAGFALGSAGFGNPESAEKDPQIVQKYANWWQQAQKDGTDQLIGITPQQFAQNPRAYLPKLSDFVNQSGQLSAVNKQAADQVTLRQSQLGQVRTAYAQALANAQGPGDYPKIVAEISKQFPPEVVAAANLAPSGMVQTPAQLSTAKESAALSQMSPEDRTKFLQQKQHETNQDISGRLQAQSAAAEAATKRGELGVHQVESQTAFGAQPLNSLGGGAGGAAVPAIPGGPGQPPATGGVPQAPTPSAPTGRVATSLTPPINGPRATAQAASIPVAAPVVPQAPTAPTSPAGKFPVLTVDGKKIDLNGTTPTARAWQLDDNGRPRAPLVQQAALNLLTGNADAGAGMAGIPGMALMNQAKALALKINPHYVQQSEARKDVYGTVAQQAIQSSNQAIAHSEVLTGAAKKLNNTNYPIINTATLIAKAQSGQPEPTEFENARDAYVREVGKAFAGGQLGEKEFEQAAGRIAKANSTQAMLGAVKINNKLLMDAMQDREKIYNDQNNGAIMGDRQRFILDDSKRILKSQGLMNYEVGDVRVTKGGAKIRLTKVAPNGQYEGVPVE